MMTPRRCTRWNRFEDTTRCTPSTAWKTPDSFVLNIIVIIIIIVIVVVVVVVVVVVIVIVIIIIIKIIFAIVIIVVVIIIIIIIILPRVSLITQRLENTEY